MLMAALRQRVFFSKSCPGLELFDPRQYIRYVVEANTAMGWGGRYIPHAHAKFHTTQKPLIRDEVGTHAFRGVFRASEEDGWGKKCGCAWHFSSRLWGSRVSQASVGKGGRQVRDAAAV
jgi:hypothetical protein